MRSSKTELTGAERRRVPPPPRTMVRAVATVGLAVLALELGFVSAVLPAAPALAQASLRARAKAAFQAGERAFEEGDVEAALAHFRRAQQLAPHDAVRFNVAVCLERLGRPREALAEYRAAARSETLPEAARRRARRELERLEQEVGQDLERESDRDESAVEQRLDGGDDVQEARSSHREDPATSPDVVAAEPETNGRRGPSALTWTGLAALTVGGAGSIGFGLRTRTLHNRFVTMPDADRQEDGVRMRRLTNASIGIASAGALMMLVDLLWLARRSEEGPHVSLRPAELAIRF